MSLPMRLTDGRSLECSHQRLISWHRPKQRFLNMGKTLFVCFVLLLLCSLCRSEALVSGVSKRPNDGVNQDKSVTPPLLSDNAAGQFVPVSSAVENAKRILGIDSTEKGNAASMSPGGARNTRKLLNKIKHEFSSKMLHASEAVDAGESSEKIFTTVDKVNFKDSLKASQMAVPHEKGKIAVKSSDEKVSNIVSDLEKRTSAKLESDKRTEIESEKLSVPKIKSSPSDVKHSQSVVAKSETSSKESTGDIKPRATDLPERFEEYVKSHLVEGEDLHLEKTSHANLESGTPLEDVSSVDKHTDENQEGGSDGEASLRDGSDSEASSRDGNDGEASSGDGSGNVPPVVSKLEQEVVSAIKVRAHNLANTTIDSSQLIDSPNNLFTDNGDRTSIKFPDPRHFFTNLSSKSFTRGRNGAAGSSVTRGNSSAHDFRKIIIFPQKKGFRTDDGNETKDKVFRGDDAGTSAGADKTPKPQKPEKESDLIDAGKTPEGETAAKEKEDHVQKRSSQEETKEREKDEDSKKVDIVPTTVVSDSEEKKEKSESEPEASSKSEESAPVEKQTKSKEGKEKKKAKEDSVNEVKDVTSDEKEKEVVEEKSEIETSTDVEGKVTSTDVEGKVDSESQKQTDKGEGGDKGKEEEKTEGKEVEGGEDGKLKVEEGKVTKDETGKDKVEDDKVEEKSEADAEEPGKGKKQSDSKKKDKKKTEEAEDATSKPPVETDEEVINTGDEKTDDTLETYSQFTQRVSAEKKNDATTNGHGTNGHTKGSKVKGKNYASPDCGAKLVTANPEASHTSKVIHPNKDEYMLNKCRDKIWFIIELCESIRPQKFDIANFELFSNLPKDIQVLGNHRYPSRDWTSFGWFKGQEGNRGLQSFRVETEDFFKYIKVEVTNNYGSEFYCPISTFQIFGLSEFEVIDTIEDQAEDTDDDNEPYIDPVEETIKKKNKEEGKQSVIPAVLKNMFSGVMDVIKRGYRPSSSASEPGENCYSLHPKFAIENEICPMAGSLNYILSCYKMEYETLMQQPFVSSTVKNSSFCRQLALTMCAEPEVNDSIVYDTTCNNSYVCVMLSPKHVLAMCFMQDPQILDKGISCESGGTVSENFSATPDLLPSIDAPAYVKNADINTSSITRSDALDTNLGESLDFQIKKSSSEVIKDGKVTIELKLDKKDPVDTVPVPESSVAENGKPAPKELKANGNGAKDKVAKEGGGGGGEQQEATERVAEPEERVEVEGSGLGGIDMSEEEVPPPPPAEEPSPTVPPPAPSSTLQPVETKVSNSPTNKESVVVRLSNKIKALEYNMSISSQYLEELSRRYKRQMEEMQRQFNLTIAALNNTSTQAYERDQHHQRDIENLEEQLANVNGILQKLVDERETLAHTVVEQHVLLMVVEVIVLCMVFTMCFRRRSNYSHNSDYGQTRRNQTPSEDPSGSAVDQDANCLNSDSLGRLRVRRRSVDSITSERNSRLRQRRPSEEALNISGTYQDLLIIEPAIPILMDSFIDRKKKRKSSNGTLKRSKSNASIIDKSSSSRRAKRIEKLNESSAGVLFCGDEVDSKTTLPPPGDSPIYAPNSLDSYGLMHDPLSNDESSVFYEYVGNSHSFHNGSMLSEIGLAEGVPNDIDSISKKHAVACFNCDNGQRKDKLTKSLSLGSAPEKTKSTLEKVKKVKKQKKAKVKDSPTIYADSSQPQSPIYADSSQTQSPIYADSSQTQSTIYADSSQTQSPFPPYNKDYYYPKPNGISYCSPIETYDSYYYNGHTSVHFSEDTTEHCDHTYSRVDDLPVNGGYSNGIDVTGADHYRHINEFSHTNHDTPHTTTTEKKKMSPKVKSKVKLRSDNWEWYSSQHVGGSSSETVSTCSDSSGKNRKVKKEEQTEYEKSDDKKGKRKKKSKSKSSVLIEEDTVLEVEAGT